MLALCHTSAAHSRACSSLSCAVRMCCCIRSGGLGPASGRLVAVSWQAAVLCVSWQPCCMSCEPGSTASMPHCTKHSAVQCCSLHNAWPTPVMCCQPADVPSRTRGCCLPAPESPLLPLTWFLLVSCPQPAATCAAPCCLTPARLPYIAAAARPVLPALLLHAAGASQAACHQGPGCLPLGPGCSAATACH